MSTGRNGGGGGGGKRTGELAEIQKALIRLSGQRGPIANSEKREHFRKVINNMTIGIDMSGLFTQMVLACSNEDLVLKKMLYQYVRTYATYHPDNVLLTINTLQKDCQDMDPKLRGLALRTLCSLKVGNLLEYLVNPLKVSLEDQEAYVRRTAVMGVYKVYHLDPDVVDDQGFVDRLYAMLLGDGDSQVVSNCLEALIGIRGVKKMCTKETVYHLLNILKDFSEWGQCQVMDFVSHYRPEDENEIFEVMNILEDRMTHSNSAVVLAVCKLYLHITLSMPATHQQVLERIKSPLLTLVGHDSPEVAFAVLSHLHLLISRAPVLFSHDFKDFFCKFADPTYIKKLKMEILTAIADTGTAYEICTELSEYVSYGDISIAREAVRSVGRIALEVPDVPGICDRLLSFLDVSKPAVAAETLVIIKDLLRRYPERADECISAVSGISPADISEPQARAAFIWLLGEHGKGIQDAPYLLEAVSENLGEQTRFVKLAMLNSCMKLFFQRPPECQRLLGCVLKSGSSDQDQDVQDRVLMYYRLLQHSTDAAARVVCPTLPVVHAFVEEHSAEIKDRVFDEFNTLSVIFRAPSASFLDKDTAHDVNDEPAPEATAQPAAELADDGLLEYNELLDIGAGSQVDDASMESAPSNGGSSAADPLVNLLDLDDVLSAPSSAPASCAAPVLELQHNPVLEPAAYQVCSLQYSTAPA
mmetsp:Transcript_24163/g.62817  ORF Transcript_24163/g.62817 Transcript_24163/m.62817 type:complete len:701 (+) Transcript_24163:309-2411(+)